ncbi:MAG: recombinase family protein [Pseudonocardiaceae bacterium]
MQPTPQVREYLRVSKDTAGHERSPQEQHKDNERAAAELGFEIGEPYRDIGSASRYARKSRKGFDQLVADLSSDRFGADVLMLWESSRGSRRVGEWVSLIELCEQRHVRIHVTTHGRTYDPANHRDRRSLLEDAVDSEYESAKKSDRLRRSAAAAAADGRPVSRVPYGYRTEYDPHTGKPLGRSPEPAEAAVVVELYQRVAAGESIRGIATSLAKRGVEKRSGGPFSAAHLRSLLNYRGYIAERAYLPGRTNRWRRRDEATITPAKWEPIVDRGLWFQVHGILADQARVKNRPGGARHLLSMIARCDPCGGPLNAIVEKGNPVYRCRDRGCVRVSQPDLEQVAVQRLLRYLAAPEVYRELRQAGEDADEALAKIEAELAGVRHELTDLEQRVAAGRLTLEFAERVEPGIRTRLKALQERRDEMATPSLLRGLVDPGEDVRARWDATTDVAWRRRLMQVVLSPRLAGELRVMRSSVKNQRTPVVDRVVFLRQE